MRHPLSTSGSRGFGEGAVAVGSVRALVIADAAGQAVPEDLEPTVAQRAESGVVAFPGGNLAVIELPGPAPLLQAAKHPLVHGVAEVSVVRQAAGDDEIALAGTAGDRGPELLT